MLTQGYYLLLPDFVTKANIFLVVVRTFVVSETTLLLEAVFETSSGLRSFIVS